MSIIAKAPNHGKYDYLKTAIIKFYGGPAVAKAINSPTELYHGDMETENH